MVCQHRHPFKLCYRQGTELSAALAPPRILNLRLAFRSQALSFAQEVPPKPDSVGESVTHVQKHCRFGFVVVKDTA